MRTNPARHVPMIAAAATVGLLTLTGCGTGGSSTATSTVTVAPSTSQSAPVTAATSAAPAEATSTQPVVESVAGTVNIKDFFGHSSGGDGYFFQSPSGNVKCALKITTDPSIPPGCVAEKSVQSNTGVTCANDIGSFYLLALENGEAVSKCEGPETPHINNAQNEAGMAGGRVLNTGETIAYNGVTCTSYNNEIRCRLDGTNRGFELSESVNDTRRY